MTYTRVDMESKVDALPVAVHRWLPTGDPRGTVVIAHGAAEHALRYGRFAEVLNGAGLSVWAPDHRGHGASAGPAGLGDYGEAGWAGLVADLGQVIAMARAALPEAPLCLLGHSMGSFAAQDLIAARSGEVDALVLSGSTAIARPPSGERVATPAFNAAFEPARTPYDWLSRDEAEVDAYVADPLCGFERRASGARGGTDFARLASPELFAGARSELPVLLLSGDQDPIHRDLAGLRLLEERLRGAGLTRVDTRYYAGGRHEMLNEENRDEVMADALAWMLDALQLTGSRG